MVEGKDSSSGLPGGHSGISVCHAWTQRGGVSGGREEAAGADIYSGGEDGGIGVEGWRTRRTVGTGSEWKEEWHQPA
jgi:hypothetical protein